ncbi:MAG TPA: hypothetical protein VGH23_01610 [Rhizomicrobium sp.]|jgi:hypothetical protein
MSDEQFYAGLYASNAEMTAVARRVKKMIQTHAKYLEPDESWTYGKRIAADFMRHGRQITEATVREAFDGLIAQEDSWESIRDKRMADALEVGDHLRELAPDLREESFEDVAALVAYELERQALDISDATIKTILDNLRRRQPRHFITDEARAVLMALKSGGKK